MKEMPIQRVECGGDAYQTGYQHGQQAQGKVKGSIEFYQKMFWEYTRRSWDEIGQLAVCFGETIQTKWPEYALEMQGLADGAGCSLCDILALNTRTEIAFGLMQPDKLVSDGCTSLGWCMPGTTLMGQNWDWMEEQAANIIFLTIRKPGSPVIKMVTEAGIVGKIGMNSSGLGICLNAVRCTGYDSSRLPIHLALRYSLECETIEEASAYLEKAGTAGSGFLLLGQKDEVVGLEFTSSTTSRMKADHRGRIIHSNHLVTQHEGAKEWPEPDSLDRLDRMLQLTGELGPINMTISSFAELFDDHAGAPFSICRQQTGASKDATLFNIVMDLEQQCATVKLGRRCEGGEVLTFNFD